MCFISHLYSSVSILLRFLIIPLFITLSLNSRIHSFAIYTLICFVPSTLFISTSFALYHYFLLLLLLFLLFSDFSFLYIAPFSPFFPFMFPSSHSFSYHISSFLCFYSLFSAFPSFILSLCTSSRLPFLSLCSLKFRLILPHLPPLKKDFLNSFLVFSLPLSLHILSLPLLSFLNSSPFHPSFLYSSFSLSLDKATLLKWIAVSKIFFILCIFVCDVAWNSRISFFLSF